MFSLNVPVPGRVKRLAGDLAPHLAAFERVRADHTLVCKRLGDPEGGELDAREGRIRRALSGTTPFTARVDGIGTFEHPPAGPGPVVYLSVESPGLQALHQRLCETFDPVPQVEGAGYTPHVTLARGGAPETAAALAAREIEGVEWTVDAVAFWARDDGGQAGRVRLPG